MIVFLIILKVTAVNCTCLIRVYTIIGEHMVPITSYLVITQQCSFQVLFTVK